VPEELERTVSRREMDLAHAALASWAPGAAGAHLRSVACMYTMTPDEHFIIGHHPGAPGAVVAGGFSGHGFKFSSVVGEILADLVTHGSTAHPIALFDPNRFAGAIA
jgi:sarcosine oxidase